MARLAVTGQMIADLIILGLTIKIMAGTARRRKQRQSHDTDAACPQYPHRSDAQRPSREHRGRQDRPRPWAELPGDTSRRKLTLPLILFAVLRALVIAGTVALAFGLNLPHGYRMPIAAIVAMKASLDQSTLAAAQRLAGALIGAAAAALLLIPANEHGLRLSRSNADEVAALIFLMHGAAVRFWNYAGSAVAQGSRTAAARA